ncbi:hypothetical protein DPS71_07590 [Salmonella enterica subsp. enterica]|nr:hypothetical protein [Salmonella enterica subsp. enterica serovar Typhimurium]ECD4628050.1 hypothetical protein [Salmonella enterica subsp. enterica serovar Typhimurium]
MNKAKKLIIASVLSMMTASCYAGSIVAGSEQQSSVDRSVSYNGHQWFIYNINDKLGIKLAGDQNIPADVFPMTVNIAAYQA